MTEALIQGSDEWLAARCGKVTASRIGDLIARTKTGPSASRANYLAQLIAERLTGSVARGYVSAEMQWGTDHEADACAAYAFMHDAELAETGFVLHPAIDGSGASPDRLVAADGLLEVKCPNTATHLDTLLSGVVPQRYQPQMQWQMACTGRQWCDFASFDPRLPPSMRLFVRRVPRDDDVIALLEKEVRTFLAELEAKVAALVQTYERAA